MGLGVGVDFGVGGSKVGAVVGLEGSVGDEVGLAAGAVSAPAVSTARPPSERSAVVQDAAASSVRSMVTLGLFIIPTTYDQGFTPPGRTAWHGGPVSEHPPINRWTSPL